MAIIVRLDDHVMLLSKGADDYYSDRIVFEGKENYNSILQFSQNMGRKGLRSLAYCGRYINQRQLSLFITASEKANAVQYEQLWSEACKDLWVLGLLSFEDALQPGVEEVIEKLAETGISVWIITGDKPETALEVGRQIGLLHDREVFYYTKQIYPKVSPKCWII